MVCYLLISISLLLHIRNYRLFWILYVSLLFQIMLLYFLNDYSSPISNTLIIINITITLTIIPVNSKPNPEVIVIINGGDPKAASELKLRWVTLVTKQSSLTSCDYSFWWCSYSVWNSRWCSIFINHHTFISKFTNHWSWWP